MATYTVKRGDTLSKIAQELFGDSSRWPELLNSHPDAVSVSGDPTTLKVGFTFNTDEASGGDKDDSSSSSESPPEDLNEVDPLELNGVPNGEIWEVDGTYYYVDFVVDIEPPVPMVWEVSSDDDLQAFFGPDQEIVVSRTMDLDTFNASGALNFGFTDEIPSDTEHAYDVFLRNYEQEAEIRPWLLDPEMLALHQMAIIEGRTITEAEYKTTEWWKTHSQAERDWLALDASDPATANQLITDNEIRVRDLLEGAGIVGYDDDLVNTLANNFTIGRWSEIYLTDQIEALAVADMSRIDDDLLVYEVERSSEGVESLRSALVTWLGPAYSASGWTDESLQKWAADIRNGAKTEDDFIQLLQEQRVQLLPEYADPTRSYEDIVSPWRSRWNQVLGEAPNEMDSEFVDAVRLNNLTQFDTAARTYGLANDNEKVINDGLRSISSAYGGQVIRSAV